jgi:hypothetical protein
VFRSVTSEVSAISSFVANGHQTMHYVSSSLSKIPYGGFSPVRLQTGIQPQSSLVRCGLSARPTYTRILSTHMGLKSLTQNRAYTFRRRAQAQAAPFPHLRPIQSRGPWLPEGLCCPPGTSLTMASSETLNPSNRLMNYTMGLCPPALYGLALRGSPICSACLFPPCRPTYPDGPNGCI